MANDDQQAMAKLLRLTLLRLACAAVIILGLLLVMQPMRLLADPRLDTILGVALMLLGLAGYFRLSRRKNRAP